MFKDDFSSHFWTICHKNTKQKNKIVFWARSKVGSTSREPAVLQQLNWRTSLLWAKMSTSCACLWRVPQPDPVRRTGLGQRTATRIIWPNPSGFQRDPPLEFESATLFMRADPIKAHCLDMIKTGSHTNRACSSQSQVSEIWSGT